MLYNPPSGSIDPNAPYVGKNLAAGTQGSKVPRLAIEATQREIVNAIVQSGQSPTNDDLTQLWKAMQMAAAAAAPVTSLWHAGDDTGAPNALVVDVTPNLSDYVKYTVVETKVANTNTGPATINVDNRGPRGITRADGTPVRAGDMIAGEVVTLLYDGANFQISGILTSSQPSSSSVPFSTPGAGMWIPPAGVTQLKRIRIWGGGGSGGGTAAGSGNAGSGGGGGAYAEAIGVSCTPGVAVPYMVGGGGALAAGSGNNGGTSSWGGVLTAPGGSGGAYSSGGVPGTPAGAGATVASGGNVLNRPGGDGGTSAGGGLSGVGGSAYTSSQSGPNAGTNGADGAFPAGGGAGAGGNAGGGRNGGAGASGFILIEY